MRKPVSPKRQASNQPRRQSHTRFQLLRLAGLVLLGNLVLLSIPLITLLAIGVSTLMFFSANTPLEWLLMETCALVGTIGLLATYDLLKTQTTRLDGLELKQKQAPELFSMVKRRCHQFGLPPIDRVLLTETASIKLVITPTRAMSGAYMQTLHIGWPLLSFLSFKQFRVALNAELGQHSGSSLMSTSSINRQSVFWQGLSQHYAKRTFPAAWLLRKPITSFANYFESRSYEICQTQILEHDQLALEYTDEKEVLSLIAATALGEAFLDKKYWPMIFAAAEKTADPVVKPFTNLNAIMDRTLYQEDAERWLLQALAAGDISDQSSLRERLAMLGYKELHWTGLPRQPALETLFGCQWQTIAGQMDQRWQANVHQEWTDRHWRFRQNQDQFYALQQKAAKETITGATAIRYAKLAEEFLPKEEIVMLCKGLLRVNRTHADVSFQCGKQLLEAGSDDGIRAIEIAIQLDPNYTNQGNTLIYAFERTNRVVPFQRAAIA
ncbi:MAG: hypothetical protein V3V50_05670 [Gammaproteobacteria bacterium]